VIIVSASSEWHWLWTIAGLLVIPALVALNGFFVAAEFALVSIRRTKVSEMVKAGTIGAAAVDTATKHLDRSIAATQLGITLASIALGWVGEPTLARLLEPFFGFIPDAWRGITAHGVAIGVAFALITFMHVVFGELIPKTIALQSVDRTSLFVAQPLLVFTKLTRPLIFIMNGFGNWLLRLWGFRSARAADMLHSVEELQMIIEDTEEAGLLDEEQADIVQSVFELSDKTVRDVMVPREKMEVLDISMSSEQVLAAVRAGAHTRMPVLDGDPNKVVGIVNTKDLFYLFSLQGVVLLEDALYPATYLEPDETLPNALKLFKKSRKPMALVRDADDKILGMLTLEDVIEEIVGDIEDEHDRPTRRLQVRVRRPSPPRK
jgi:CBS domain containing-hemolysin-like protein